MQPRFRPKTHSFFRWSISAKEKWNCLPAIVFDWRILSDFEPPRKAQAARANIANNIARPSSGPLNCDFLDYRTLGLSDCMDHRDYWWVDLPPQQIQLGPCSWNSKKTDKQPEDILSLELIIEFMGNQFLEIAC